MDGFSAIAVVNRRNVTHEGMFDGVTVIFKPHETKHYPPNIAYALVQQSVLRIDLASGLSTVYALGLPDDRVFPSDPLDGPLADTNAVEILDRTHVEKLTETEPKVLGQDGAEDLGIGKVEKTVTPLPGAEPNPETVVRPAAADEVQAMSFVNQDVKRGSQRPGRAEHRINTKPA